MLNIIDLKLHKNNGNIYITQHCDTRMRERKISNIDIYRCIDTGEIIKQYDNDKPLPSCLICGYSGNRPIHIVVSDDGENLFLITAYEPDPYMWTNNFKEKK